MTTEQIEEGRRLIAAVQDAARNHAAVWRELVPDALTVNVVAEAAEEAAYAELVTAKAALSDHICRAYGLSPRELSRLALP